VVGINRPFLSVSLLYTSFNFLAYSLAYSSVYSLALLRKLRNHGLYSADLLSADKYFPTIDAGSILLHKPGV